MGTANEDLESARAEVRKLIEHLVQLLRDGVKLWK